MKKLGLCVALGLLMSTSSFASALLPVAVTEVSKNGNFMPPVAPGTKAYVEVTFTASVGCLTASDFEAKVLTVGTTQMLGIQSTTPDCEIIPKEKSMTIKAPSLNADYPITLMNPVLVIDKTTH